MNAAMFSTGIEIEAGLRGTTRFNQLVAAELASQFADKGEGWVSKQDGSSGHELVSGIITSREQLVSQVTTAVELAQRFDLRIHRHCGLHVHVGFKEVYEPDLSAKYRLFRFLSCYEEAIFKLWSPWEERANYCQRLRDSHYESVTTGEGLKSLLAEDGRYWWVNVKSMVKHGTLEFRIANGSLDVAEITGWVAVLQCIFHAVCRLNVKLPWHEDRSLVQLIDDAKFDQHPIFGQEARRFVESRL